MSASLLIRGEKLRGSVLDCNLETHDVFQTITIRKIDLFLCLINEAPCHEDVWRSGATAPPFLTSALKRVSCQFHTLADLPPSK
jgi:hypothetical protein